MMLTLLTGFLVGRVHIKGFSPGTVRGVLLVGIAIGSFHINRKLEYTVAYAVTNITLTTSGVIIVLLMHKGS